MDETDVLKEFLVALGFKIDLAQEKKFFDSVLGATKNVNKLGAAAAAAVIGTTAAVAKISEVMDKLYFVSQRTGSSVSAINAFDYGISQLGGSSDDAKASLENLGRFIRSYPGSGEFLKRLGVDPAHVTSAVDSMKDLQKVFQAMPQYQGLAYANVLGIDEKTFYALRSGELNKQMDDYNDRLKRAGVNGQDAAEKGHAFMQSLRGVGAAAEVLGAALEEKLAPALSKVVGLMDKSLQGAALGLSDPKQFVANEQSAFADAHARNMRRQELIKSGMTFEQAQAIVDGPPPAAPALSHDETQKQLTDYFVSQGWTPEVAAGIVRRLNDESGLNSTQKNQYGEDAYGLFQAHKPWRKDFKDTMGHDIFGTSALEQAKFISMALKGETKSGDPDAQRLGRQLSGLHDEKEAYRLYNGEFEKSAAGVKAMTINAPTTINVNGTGNPMAVGNEVTRNQGDIYKSLIRQGAQVPQ